MHPLMIGVKNVEKRNTNKEKKSDGKKKKKEKKKNDGIRQIYCIFELENIENTNSHEKNK